MQRFLEHGEKTIKMAWGALRVTLELDLKRFNNNF